jgi:hypothetical protein
MIYLRTVRKDMEGIIGLFVVFSRQRTLGMIVSVQLRFEKGTSQTQVRSFTFVPARRSECYFVHEGCKEYLILFSGNAML